MRKLLLLTLLISITSACARLPLPPQPQPAMPVNASAGKTWDAVIDVFGERNIPIKNMERVSGFISTDFLRAALADTSYADCGRQFLGATIWPTLATYNVIVRGDSSASTVRVNVRWTSGDAALRSATGAGLECSTNGKWETAFEARVKAIAEAKR